MTADLSLSARGLALLCLGVTLIVDAFLRNVSTIGFSAIFAQLLGAGDLWGNWLLLLIVAGAFLLRDHARFVLAGIEAVGSRPWWLAAALFPLLCLGSLQVYHQQPISMDEYAAVFQAQAFAAGRLSGQLPSDLLDVLIAPRFHNVFLTLSRTTGEVSSTYWPGFSLLMAPFALLNAAWAVNPAIGALALPVVHRLTRAVTGSARAAAWSVMLTTASPVFIVDSISFYAMQAHLLLNAVFTLLLLHPTLVRAASAGVVGSLALTLHQPVPHLLFMVPFAVWLAWRPATRAALAALAVGYVPLGLVLGVGWHQHIFELLRSGASSEAAASPGRALTDTIFDRIRGILALPTVNVAWARVAGLTKIWTWGAAGLLALAASGCAVARGNTAVRLMAAAALTTFVGYFFFPPDQGHGWGFRYFHSAWFVLPVLAAAGLQPAGAGTGGELRGMAAWLVVLSLVFANTLRLAEVECFTSAHLGQVPPLARPVAAGVREIVFVRAGSGYYVEDLVQNDPFLRAARITMWHPGAERVASLMTTHFPDYVKQSQGDWGESWIAPLSTPNR
jgi:hypothetical protein